MLLLSNGHIDILCISESWLPPELHSSLVDIPEYSIYRCDRGRGGGVCIYIKDHLKVTMLTTQYSRPPHVEDLWMTVQSKKFPSFILGCIYRHPHALDESFDYISDVFGSMSLRNKPLLILGDFNDNLFLPNNKMKNIMNIHHLSQLVTQPTRITATSSTLIDLIITNRPNFIINSEVLSYPVGDHEIITATINIRKEKRSPTIKTFRSLESYSQNYLCELLLNEVNLLNAILITDCSNEQVLIFTNAFAKCIDICAPFVTKEIKRPPAPWIDSPMKEAMKVRDNLHRTFKLNRLDPIAENKYKCEKRTVKLMLSDKRKSYFKEEFSKCRGDIRGTWDVIKKIIPIKKESFDALNSMDVDPQIKAENFNTYFANVGKCTFEKAQKNILQTHQTQSDEHSTPSNGTNKFRPQPVDIDTLILTIKHLKPTNACGSDGISFRFLIDSLPITIFYILIIVNTSIVTGKNPDLWKHPYVVPAFKSGDPENIGNYRPISLLPVISKILEKIVANQLMAFLETNKLLAQEQHGFRPGLSTETALLKVTNQIYANIENRKISLLLLLDLSKAFDSVHHQTLISKLAKVNVDSFWFDNYISSRIQSVRIGTILSSPMDISFGVPQGSILGPLLFLIYINDLPQYIRECLLVIYADDTQIMLTGDLSNIDDLVHRAENILIAAKNYFNNNGLLLNESKTQIIFFGSRQYISRIPENISIKFNDITLVPSQKVKNLGVIMDSNMTFNAHIDELHKKVIGTLLYLNRVCDRFQPDCRIMVVQSLVLSVLNYCLRIWGSTNKTQLERVQKLQNFAAKIAVGGARKHDHVTPILQKLEWLQMEMKYFYDICLLVFKINNNLLPEWLFSLPTVNQARAENINTRHQNSLFVPRTFTDTGARSLNVVGPSFWNRLPLDIRNCQTISSFKSNLIKHLVKK